MEMSIPDATRYLRTYFPYLEMQDVFDAAFVPIAASHYSSMRYEVIPAYICPSYAGPSVFEKGTSPINNYLQEGCLDYLSGGWRNTAKPYNTRGG